MPKSELGSGSSSFRSWLICATAVFCSLSFLASSAQAQVIQPHRGDRLSSNGRAHTLIGWHDNYYTCLDAVDIEKEEYETREEFKIRRAKLERSKNCAAMWPLEGAVVTKPVALSYNSDSEQFTFKVKLGKTPLPPRFAHADNWLLPEHQKPSPQQLCDEKIWCYDDGNTGGTRVEWIVCWVMGQDTLTATGTDPAFFDSDPTVQVEQSGDTVRMCRRASDRGSVDIAVRSDIHKARKLKASEQSLRIEFEGRSEYFLHCRQGGDCYKGMNRYAMYVFHVAQIRLINQEDGNVLFSAGQP